MGLNPLHISNLTAGMGVVVIRCIVMKCCANIAGPQRMNPVPW